MQDPSRLAALRRLDLEHARTEAFDRLARLAARYLSVPVTLVAMVEEDRQLFAGSVGLPEPFASTRQIPAEYSYCRYVVEGRKALAVEDAREHPLFHEHPALLDFGVVAYLGVPIFTTGGHVLGSFCAIDCQRRPWSPEQIAYLEDLTASVMTEIELRQELREHARTEQAHARAEARRTRILESITDAFFSVDRQWRFTYVNRAAEGMLRRSRAELIGSRLWDVYPEAGGTTFEREYRRAVEEGVTAAFEEYFEPLDAWFSVHAYPSDEGLAVYFQNISERKLAEARQAATEAHYRRLVTTVPEAVYVVDVEGCFTELNPAAERILGRTAQEVIGTSFAAVMAPESLSPVREIFTQVISGQADDVPFETCIRRPSGEERVLAITVTSIRDDGRVTGLHGIARDVTEERTAARTLRESEERFRTLVEVLGEGVMITDLEERILYTNQRTSEITGYSATELVGKVASELLLPPEERHHMLTRLLRRAEGESDRYELRQHRKDGSMVWVEVSGSPLRDGAGQVVGTVGAITDITERKELEQALRRMSTTDVLTDLLNRRGFLELAQREWALAARRDQDLLLVYLDLDDFKAINDTFGHAEGDRLLQDVAGILRQSFRSTDLIARMGGDEFVVLAVDAGEEPEASLSARVQEAIHGFNRRSGRPYQLRGSIGVHRAPAGTSTSLDALVAEADRQMYERKRLK